MVNTAESAARLRHDVTLQMRIGLAILGIPNLIVGGWALFAPRSWYEDFPATGRGWVAVFGAYNEHFIQDIGTAYLGFGTLLVFACFRPSYLLVRGALLAFLVFAVPHLLIHVFVRESLSTTGYVGTLAPQVLAVAVAGWLMIRSASLRDDASP